MIKVETDPKLLNIRTENSVEIVGTSYGGVPKEYFLDVLSTGLIDAHGVLSNKRAALRVSVNHGEMDDFSAARMILCGIPLDESYLQHRLSFLMKEEKKSLRGGKLHVPECCYLMGAVDQVCVILMEYLACEKPKEDGRARKATAADQSKNGMLEPWLQSKGLSDAKSRQQLQLAVAVWATVQ
uniref:RNA-dependent RNA polymerase n=1 Tax=Fagus sylvatica TaxID=28930 RepID=A0A2N9I688_FAGSY